MDPDFVRAGRSHFTLRGSPFPVSGVNCYFLGFCSAASRTGVIAAAKGMGASVIRSWAFLMVDAYRPGAVAFQYPDQGRIRVHDGPDGLERLDALIAAAEQNGIRLILPFVNHWENFGGAPAYLRWLGI